MAHPHRSKQAILEEANAKLAEWRQDEQQQPQLAVAGDGPGSARDRPPEQESEAAALNPDPVAVTTLEDLPIGAQRCFSVHGRPVVVFHREAGLFALDAVCYHMGGPLVEGDVEDLASCADEQSRRRRSRLPERSGHLLRGRQGLQQQLGPDLWTRGRITPLLLQNTPSAPPVARPSPRAALPEGSQQQQQQQQNRREVVVCPWHRYYITLDTGEGMYMDLDGGWKSKGPRQRTHAAFVRDARVFVALRSGDNKLPSDEYAEMMTGISVQRLAKPHKQSLVISASPEDPEADVRPAGVGDWIDGEE